MITSATTTIAVVHRDAKLTPIVSVKNLTAEANGIKTLIDIANQIQTCTNQNVLHEVLQKLGLKSGDIYTSTIQESDNPDYMPHNTSIMFLKKAIAELNNNEIHSLTKITQLQNKIAEISNDHKGLLLKTKISEWLQTMNYAKTAMNMMQQQIAPESSETSNIVANFTICRDIYAKALENLKTLVNLDNGVQNDVNYAPLIDESDLLQKHFDNMLNFLRDIIKDEAHLKKQPNGSNLHELNNFYNDCKLKIQNLGVAYKFV